MAYARFLLSTAACSVMLAGATALAQDASVTYTTPIIHAGQPVVGATVVQPVPVFTEVPRGTPAPVVDARTGVAVAVPPTTPPTAADSAYLGVPQIQASQHNAGVRFVTGGTGLYEKAWFEQNANQFDLKLQYAANTGHHLAGVNVTLLDASGTTVLTAVTDGPHVLIDVPSPGRYTLVSEYQGQRKTSRVNLGRGLKRATITFHDHP